MGYGNLLIALSIRNLSRCAGLIEKLKSIAGTSGMADDWALAGLQLEFFPTSESLTERLGGYFEETTEPIVIVVSDMLAEHGQATSVAMALVEKRAPEALTTLAVNDYSGRVPDIDRVVAPDVETADLIDVLTLLVARLKYLSPPVRRSTYPPFILRRINGEFELKKYYELRHRVYKIMGYLSENKEDVPSRMEIDWCDKNAIHLGAFEQSSGFDKLAGTVRILFSNPLNTRYVEWTDNLLKSDNRLRAQVSNEHLQFGLPVFHSHNLNPHIKEVVEHDLSCAELSRVIVDENYRGAGLAVQLTSRAIEEACLIGVDRIYLECLRLHEALYEKFGFQRIEGSGGRVIGIGKSMIAMHREIAGEKKELTELAGTALP